MEIGLTNENDRSVFDNKFGDIALAIYGACEEYFNWFFFIPACVFPVFSGFCRVSP